MCGRYALHSHPQVVALHFGLAEPPAFAPRYNVAPLTTVPIVRADLEGGRRAELARWGLLPSWARDPKIASRLINARAETLAGRPAFRDAFRRRRCLIPANGFYEWKAEGGRKQPYYVHPAQGELFAFAGLYERCTTSEGPLETCAIVTTDADATLRAIHPRMPLILAPGDYAPWLAADSAAAARLLRAHAAPAVAVRRVGRAVNNAREDSPTLIEPEEA